MYKNHPKLHEIQVAPNLECSYHNCLLHLSIEMGEKRTHTNKWHHTRNFPFYFLCCFRVCCCCYCCRHFFSFLLFQVIQFWINDEITDKPDYLGNFSTTALKTTKTSTTMTHFRFFFVRVCVCVFCCGCLKRISLNRLLSNIISTTLYNMRESNSCWNWQPRATATVVVVVVVVDDAFRCESKYLSFKHLFFFSITFTKKNHCPILWLLLIGWVEWNEQVHNIIMPMVECFPIVNALTFLFLSRKNVHKTGNNNFTDLSIPYVNRKYCFIYIRLRLMCAAADLLSMSSLLLLLLAFSLSLFCSHIHVWDAKLCSRYIPYNDRNVNEDNKRRTSKNFHMCSHETCVMESWMKRRAKKNRINIDIGGPIYQNIRKKKPTTTTNSHNIENHSS